MKEGWQTLLLDVDDLRAHVAKRGGDRELAREVLRATASLSAAGEAQYLAIAPLAEFAWDDRTSSLSKYGSAMPIWVTYQFSGFRSPDFLKAERELGDPGVVRFSSDEILIYLGKASRSSDTGEVRFSKIGIRWSSAGMCIAAAFAAWGFVRVCTWVVFGRVVRRRRRGRCCLACGYSLEGLAHVPT